MRHEWRHSLGRCENRHGPNAEILNLFLCAFASEMGRLHVDVCLSVCRAQATRATVSRARISTNVS